MGNNYKAFNGSLDIFPSLNDFFQIVAVTGFTELTIDKQHLLKLKDLPLIHKDPFDRIIISQAIHENLTIITRDSLIRKYDVATLW